MTAPCLRRAGGSVSPWAVNVYYMISSYILYDPIRVKNFGRAGTCNYGRHSTTIDKFGFIFDIDRSVEDVITIKSDKKGPRGEWVFF